MPHINRIRVNNVKYNFGTQFYDDFLMRFSCKNTIYDLANGGGKSVLMLLLLQNLIPNCTLDDKQPVEKLFRTNEGSTTIHSMIEWSLSDIHIKDGFKYMLTGFCARKAKDQGEAEENSENVKNGTAIEYFNYCVFYRNFNDNDIKNLPLTSNGERITYTGLKNYLKDLQKNDYNLEVKIFDRKGDYQRFIAEYGLYESEWEIIRGINKTEGHVRTYFETNYKTTRKVVEDLLIEEIIEKSFRNKYADDNNDGNLAETLLNIKDKLLELSEKKEEINNFDRQIEIIDGFSTRIASIRQLYSGIENAFTRLKKVCNSLENADIKNKKSLEEAIEERGHVIRDKNELSGKVETAKVLVDMKELERLEAELQKENENLVQADEEFQTFMERLNLLESGNYYLEYIQCRKEYDKLKLVMDNILKDNGTLLSGLKELVAVKKIADENRIQKLSEEIERETAISDKEKENLSVLEEENKFLDNSLAVAEYKAAAFETELEKINVKIADKKNKTSLLLPTDAGRLLSEEKENLSLLAAELEELKKKSENSNSVVLNQQLKLQEENYRLVSLEDKKAVIEVNSNRLLNSAEKLSKLKQVYQAEDLDKLSDKIEKTYRRMVAGLNKAGQVIAAKEDEIKALELGKPVVESGELLEVLDYIKRYHSKDAVSGSQYLSELPEETRINMVKNNPVLAYGIIVMQNFLQAAMDKRIVESLANGHTIPIINGEIINDETVELISPDNMTFVTGGAEEFSKDKMNVRITRLRNELDNLNKSYERKTENEQVVKEDYLFINHILNNCISDEELSPEKALENLNGEILRQLDVIKQLKADISNSGQELGNVRDDIDRLQREKSEKEQEIQLLQGITELLAEYAQAESEYKEEIDNADNIRKELSDGKRRYEALDNMSKQRFARIHSMEEEMYEINRLWNEKFASYFDEYTYRELLRNNRQQKLINEDLDTKLMALLESLKKDNSAVADKEKLLGNYQISMQRNMQHIDYMGVDVNVLKNMYENNELVITSSKELADIKQHSNTFKETKKRIRKSIQEMRSVRDKLQGKITHAVSIITDKYGEFDKDSIKNEEINTFLNENGRILSSLEERFEKLASSIKSMENKAINLSVLKRDVIRLMTKSGIKPDINAGIFDEDTDIEQECRKVSEQLDGFIDEKYKRAEEFEREMSLLNETLKKLNAHELASEIRMNVSMPSDLSETEELINMLKELNEYIGLEKQRVLKGLEDMQVIKDNFENQCIQSCANIKTELDRLSKLSRITMEDETISVINLKVPYVKEDTYKDRMSEYIDRVAKGADSFEKTEDKLKYIRNNLCWKKMFAVIVTDMNAIKLKLYKRERIADQSRYLPYEEAVGSTGQSQGIYIQFLISIINYISSINSRNADVSRLKKVIFIDNPFGAAKDVYIWEPIFKLLKTNNVQLVVPARGATPAISGRFDVNYVLGQKMCNGRQQTVVVDYFSNVNNDELDYTTLSYEQTALF